MRELKGQQHKMLGTFSRFFKIALFFDTFLLGLCLCMLIEQMCCGSSIPFLRGIISSSELHFLQRYLDFSNGWFVCSFITFNVVIFLLAFGWGRYFLAVAVASIMLLEFGLRIAEPYFPSHFINVPNLGIKHKPFSDSANSLGFNDKEYSREKKKGVIRIVALGDSFNWSGGYENNYWTIAEDMLAKSFHDKSIEILNQGTEMTGPDYEFKLLKQESIHFEPDVVVLSFFAGNDFGESGSDRLLNVRFGLPFEISLAEPKKIFDPMRDSYLWFFFSRYKKLWESGVFKKQEKNHGEEREGKHAKKESLSPGSFPRGVFLDIEKERARICLKSFYDESDWEMTKERLLEFKNFLRSKGVDFFVVILPDEFQANPPLRAEMFNRFPDIDREKYDFELPQKKLGEYLAHIQVGFLDLLPFFLEGSKEGMELYARSNTHFNKKGNYLAAQAVSGFLLKRIKKSIIGSETIIDGKSKAEERTDR